jgi:hypothetical protein
MCNRAQTTLLSQSTAGFEPVDSETVQVLYEQHHWVATACMGGAVLVADSLHRPISPELARQLRQLYAVQLTSAGNLRVTLIPVQRQKDASSCGVYAAAFAFEMAFGAGAGTATSLDVDFGSPMEMRRHLARCFEAKEVIPFAKYIIKKRGRKAQSRVTTI